MVARMHRRWELFVVLFAVAVRYFVSLHPHSGMASPPMYGDYEAQRHWMEITTHLPVREWYTQTKDNDLQYWGLDYPPLSAYVSWLHGKFVGYFEPDAIALFSSRGFESVLSKLLLRLTVLASDVTVFIPAVCVLARSTLAGRTQGEQRLYLLTMLLQPALILIDHGHFQYNCISLGLVLWAVIAYTRDYDVVGSVLFCLSLNFKIMSLYYSPAVFFYCLGKVFERQSFFGRLCHFFKLAVTVAVTFAVLWLPFLHDSELTLQVVHRIFPFGRGLFEDKVANFWCVFDPVFKFRRFSQPTLVRLSMIFTILGVLPGCLAVFKRPRGHNALLWALLSSSLSFFLFSYQVHEKSFLLPLLPAGLLLSQSPFAMTGLSCVGTFSMFPLLVRDGLTIPYVAIMTLYLVFSVPVVGSLSFFRRVCVTVSACLLLLTHSLLAFGTPPVALPHIFVLLAMSVSFLHFSLAWAWASFVVWRAERVKKE